MKIKTIKKLHLLLFLLVVFAKTNAQQSVVAAGGDATGSGGTSSFSIGQVVYTTETGSGTTITQGVQQPFEIFTVGIDNFPDITLKMSVYPNPTLSLVNLTIESFNELKDKSLLCKLTDINGKLINHLEITSSETQVNMEVLAAGTYFLSITNSAKTIKTFKIIKNN
jgi:hypothetical protein